MVSAPVIIGLIPNHDAVLSANGETASVVIVGELSQITDSGAQISNPVTDAHFPPSAPS